MNFNFQDIFKNMGEWKGRMEEIRARVARMQITGEAGAGMVRVQVNGEGLLLKVEIDRAIFGEQDTELLSELIVSATNEAQKKARDAMAHEMSKVTAGIPGMEKILSQFMKP
ncbi:MAG: YbaB/EbfC family nucleoid-associated protein [Spirochaetales bacterium]|nr:YbaB/EbfC family nucleoid-associated protein [Spirochaetales bacterium]